MNVQENRNLRAKWIRAFTLLELLVVLVILIATAILIIPIFTTQVEVTEGNPQSSQEISTEASMKAIKDAITGEKGVYENLGHKPEALPRSVNELVEKAPPKHLQIEAPELNHYDPVYGIGWHGPYLYPTGVNKNGESTLVDAWGNEFQLQVDFDGDGKVNLEESKHMRIVSAGPNGQIDTPKDLSNMKPGNDQTNELTMSECGDDLVLFVKIPDLRQ